jgi:hypothetical protein
VTAVSLFDDLVRPAQGSGLSEAEWTARRAALAEKLVASSLLDLERLDEYERLCRRASPSEDDATRTALDDSLHRLRSQWADEGDEVAARAKSLSASGVLVPGADRLADAIGRVRARLSLTPAQLASGTEQARRGDFTPAMELRDELRSRLRA